MFKRSERLRELLLQEISLALREVKDPGLTGFLTVTDLELAADMKSVRVYYSLLGSAQDRDSTAKALERSAGFLRKQLYGRLRLKFIPRISFRYDDTPERAHRIEDLLNRIRSGEPHESSESSEASGGPALDELAAGRRAGKASRRRRPRRNRPQDGSSHPPRARREEDPARRRKKA